MSDFVVFQRGLGKKEIEKASKVFIQSGADLLVGLDRKGEEKDNLKIIKNFLFKNGFSETRKNCFPYLIEDLGFKYQEDKHRKAAEKYRDRISDRLFHPENVPEKYQELINDDLKRVDLILKLPYKERVLEAGCSDGTISIEIAKKGVKVFGIDISPSAIKKAEKQKDRLDKSIQKELDFRVAATEDLDFPNNYFKTICLFETLEHLGYGQLEKALKNITRMLENEGNLLVSVPNRYPALKYQKQGRARWKWPTHYNFFSRLSLEYYLKKYFQTISFVPLYEKERPEDSIFLICQAGGKIENK